VREGWQLMNRPQLDTTIIIAARLSVVRCFKCDRNFYASACWLNALRRTGQVLICCGQKMWITTLSPHGPESLN
jgi:hypothetical protein